MPNPMDKPRCTARNRRGTRCERAPMRGGKVCASHGGKAPQVKAAAERRQVAQALEADALAVLAFESVEPIGDPVIALAELAAEVRATLRAVGQRVNSLESIRSVSAMGVEQMQIELNLLGAYQDRLARMLTALGQFNLDERRVQLSEAQAAVVVHALNRALHSLDLTPEREAAARAVLAAAFHEQHALTAGGHR